MPDHTRRARSPLRRYTVQAIVSAVLAVAASAAIAVVVDPYGIWGMARVAGLNASKSRIYEHRIEAKVAIGRRLRPHGIALGNSRVDVGLDPESPYWPAAARPVFNLGIAGGSTETHVKNLLRVYGDGTVPRVLVIGVDFLDLPFVPLPRGWNSKTDAGIAGLHHRFKVVVNTTLSLNAAADSVRTVMAQDDPEAQGMTPAGFNTGGTFRYYVRREGHYSIFLQRDVEYLRTLLRKAKMVHAADGRVAPPVFDALQFLIDWCRKNGVSLHLLIYPYHADLMETIRLVGLWPAFEDWKRALVALVAREQRDRDYRKIDLWDFSGYNRYSTEPVPPRGDTRSAMRWYWEAGHFKVALGEKMLARIFGSSTDDSFGVRLSPENIAEQLERIRGEAERYRTQHPAQRAHIERLYRQFIAGLQ